MDTPAEVDAGTLGIPDLLSVLEAVAEACGRREADFMEEDFFLIGALARDVLLEHIYGTEVPLTTGDVDVAVAVEGWQAYEDLRRALAEEHGFERGPEKQRLRSPEGTPLDLVPFGGVEEEGGKARFPPEGSPELTVLGFEVAWEAALPVRFGEGPVGEGSGDRGTVLRVASLEGLALLKLVSWNERPRKRARDAQDLCLLLQHFYDARLELITERHADLFDTDSFSKPKASARALGREVARLLRGPPLETLLVDTLRRETADIHQSRLARAMRAPGCHPQVEIRFACLEALLAGIEERL
jgi:predicted nucleotidyltransferase